MYIFFYNVYNYYYYYYSFVYYFIELDSKLQDALLKKEEEFLKENIRVTEETKQGFLNHLSTALESQKLEAENVLQSQLKEQVRGSFFVLIFVN